MLSSRAVFFADILKPLDCFAINLNLILLHGKWPHPSAALAVEGFVDDHVLKGFAVHGKADDLILIAFIVAV